MSCQWREKISLYVDDELAPPARQDMAQHLRSCPECSAGLIDQLELKRTVHVAGRRFTAPPELRSALSRSVRGKSRSGSAWNWSMAFAIVILAAAVAWMAYSGWKQPDPQLAELVDQHITTLASSNPVDVISEDRHTVKPWFQGKVPFAFNLPELAKTEFALIGGKSSFLGQRPAAQLLYTYGPHRITVLIVQDQSGNRPLKFYSGYSFTVGDWVQNGLRFLVATDAPREEASRLAVLLQEANRT